MLAGKGFEKGSLLGIAQAGGELGDRSMISPDDPPLRVGMTVALFVRASSYPQLGVNAVVIGGGQGAFVMAADGHLTPMLTGAGPGSVGNEVRGQTAQRVAEAAARTIGTRKPEDPPKGANPGTPDVTGTTKPA